MKNNVCDIIKCHINALRGKCEAERSRNSLMVSKNVDMGVRFYKRHQPQKPLVEVKVKTDELSISLKKLGLILCAALLLAATCSIVHNLCFSLKWRRRF